MQMRRLSRNPGLGVFITQTHLNTGTNRGTLGEGLELRFCRACKAGGKVRKDALGVVACKGLGDVDNKDVMIWTEDTKGKLYQHIT